MGADRSGPLPVGEHIEDEDETEDMDIECDSPLPLLDGAPVPPPPPFLRGLGLSQAEDDRLCTAPLGESLSMGLQGKKAIPLSSPPASLPRSLPQSMSLLTLRSLECKVPAFRLVVGSDMHRNK